MKVLHVYRTYFPDPPGGLQEAIRQICLATKPFGVESTIFTLSPNPRPVEIRRPEARVVRSRSWVAPASCDLGGLDAFATFRRLAEEADVVHYLFPWPFADMLHRVVRHRKPSVMTYISDIVRQRVLGAAYTPLMWRTLHEMSAIVANAPSYASSSPVLSDASVAGKLRVIPLGIDESSYPRDGDDSVLDRLRLDRNEPFFLFIGVLRYYKGLRTLLEAAQQLPAKIVIAGSGPEGDVLREQARQSAGARIVFAGQVSDEEKVSLLQHCRALVLPSHLRSEAYGMVLVEASMYSRPMISCEIGTGTSFVNQDSETGFVVPPESPVRLADVMRRLLEDERLAARMGLAARARYEKMFSRDALGSAYFSLFQKVLGGARGASGLQ
ncbi:glycosyltransferase [Zeimonas arvi]|uniref:Glycosyltransferase n=1 Tax=Zeimonas arvi TaxID=2498847 RepID=A0A5C8NYL3_9BURK|nr:glycosyltransferase [Zeimonas arvi]TXL66343.1 glycosyltransferase [Zeimonas arvi]